MMFTRSLQVKIEYELSPEQEKKFREFQKRKDEELYEKQKGTYPAEMFLDHDEKIPYTGAIGGGVTWHLSPYSIGMGISVTVYGEELDLTEVEKW